MQQYEIIHPNHPTYSGRMQKQVLMHVYFHPWWILKRESMRKHDKTQLQEPHMVPGRGTLGLSKKKSASHFPFQICSEFHPPPILLGYTMGGSSSRNLAAWINPGVLVSGLT